jgi:ABC-type transporter MlaC component
MERATQLVLEGPTFEWRQRGSYVENSVRRARAALLTSLLPLTLLACPRAGAEIDHAALDPKIKEIVAAIHRNGAELAGRSDDEAASICGRIAESLIDMDAVVKTGSARVFEQMSPAQRDAYRAAALRWTIKKCVQQNRDNKGEKMQLVGLREGESGDKMLAMRSEQPPHFVIWRLRAGKKLRVADILVDGVSMTLGLRNETNSLLDKSNGDIDAATTSLGR